MLRPLLFLTCLVVVNEIRAQTTAHHAVVLIPSHGGSGVVIETQPGRTWILSAAHLFEGQAKPIRIEVPLPHVDKPRSVGIHLIARDKKLDLALIELRAGPLTYVAPIAPRGAQLHRGQWLLSVGYDRLKKPPQMCWTQLESSRAHLTFTSAPPWHGRSGGALLDMKTGHLVGIVSGYERPYPAGRGIYVSLAAIQLFLHNFARPVPRVLEQRFPRPQIEERRIPQCPT